MASKTPIEVRLLSILLGLIGALIPAALLMLDEMRYDLSTFLTYAALFGLPGFLIPFFITRAVAWIVGKGR